ncbi:MAG TPA: hypothetical protein VFP70_15445, partial [Burkholderiales bacterium]|nr:hypothetical protein [Burkholderiales bacterium]
MVRAPAQRASRQRGFTYIAILLAVAIHSAVLAAVGIVWSNAQKRERERQLLYVGNEFRKAIRSYAAGAGGAGGLPESLDDLVRDPRTPALKRHIRRIYVDPMTGKAEWGLVRSGEGKGILGVYSLSEDAPLKVSNFSEEDKEFENKASYGEWKFAIRPVQAPKPVLPGTPGAPATPGAPGTPGAPPTAPGTLPGTLQPAQPGTPAAPTQPGTAAPAPIQQPPPEQPPVPVLQPTQPQQPPVPPPAQPAPQPAAPPAEDTPPAPVPDTTPAQPETPQPASPAESPFTPGLLT